MIRMDEKLTAEECERLLERVKAVMEEDVLRRSDAVKLIDVLLEACKREKADTLEQELINRFRMQ